MSAHETAAATTRAADARADSGMSLPVLHVLLSIAAFLCCVAMAIAAGSYGRLLRRSRLRRRRAARKCSRSCSASAWSAGSHPASIADKIGGLLTLLVGSMMQAVALALYFSFDGLTSLYIISILFGLFQGGIVPSYAIIVREYFPPQEAAVRVGIVVRDQRRRHGVRRMGGRLDFRSDRVLSRGFRRRLCRESFQSRDRGLAAVAVAEAATPPTPRAPRLVTRGGRYRGRHARLERRSRLHATICEVSAVALRQMSRFDGRLK